MSVLLRKWVRTQEDWYPTTQSYANPPNPDFANPRQYAAVRVDLIRFPPIDRGWKVLVQGGDDYGLEKEFTDLFEATKNYDGITQYTTKDALMRRGFVHM